MEEIIKEIAEQIDAGFIVYLNIKTNEIFSHGDPSNMYYDGEEDEYIQEIEAQIAESPADYVRFQQPDSRTAFMVMEDFTETVKDKRLRARLEEALNSKKPFRYFKDTVTRSTEVDNWYSFSAARMQAWVRDRLIEDI